MGKEDVVHTYNGILFIRKKELIWVICSDVGEPRVCHKEWGKSKREKQISYINSYIWNLEKWYWWNYLQGRNRDRDGENRLVDTVGEGEGGQIERVAWHVHATMCEIDSDWEAVM